MQLTTKEARFIYCLNQVVDCDLFKVVNKDKNWLYFKPKITFKGSNHIDGVLLSRLKPLNTDLDLLGLAFDTVREY
jgi:hypothetical protein